MLTDEVLGLRDVPQRGGYVTQWFRMWAVGGYGMWGVGCGVWGCGCHSQLRMRCARLPSHSLLHEHAVVGACC